MAAADPRNGWSRETVALVERLLNVVLSERSGEAPPAIRELEREVFHSDVTSYRVVILGGGTGMSTVVGGNSGLSRWVERPFVGLKQVFPTVCAIVCTTDDGGSTGQLVREFPLIGIGDVRKLLLSLMSQDLISRAYGAREDVVRTVVAVAHRVFNHRFPSDAPRVSGPLDPLAILPRELRRRCPEALGEELRRLCRFISKGGDGPEIAARGHCLGNLVLAAAIFRAAGDPERVGLRALREGIDAVAKLIGAPTGQLFPATATPGELVFRYANGVEVIGQSKATYSRRGFPIERVTTLFAGEPTVPAEALQRLREADLVILAPGSLYSSNIALLQVPAIVDALRANARALKVLCANFWVQEGETDISRRSASLGYLVSELIEAYERNVPGGARGLFDLVLASNLEQLPGDILRRYALENKRPIHLDRARVEKMGFVPIEAPLFELPPTRGRMAVQHDPERFALAIRALCVVDRRWPAPRRVNHRKAGAPSFRARRPAPCTYMREMQRILDEKRFRPPKLRRILEDLLWQNRDILPEHLRVWRAVRVIPPSQWGRSVEWDNVLGYFDPADGAIKLHESLLDHPQRLAEDLVIGLGEAVLGVYVARKTMVQGSNPSRCYRVELLPPSRRRTFLTPEQMNRYLRLARMVPEDPEGRVWCLPLHRDEGFIPPGLLFGLMYAWYLYNGWAQAMEYEMSLLRWPRSSLMPCQVLEQDRKRALVDFFRTVVFRHGASV